MESPVLISTDEVSEKGPDATLRIVGGAAGIPIPVDEFISVSGDAVLDSAPVPEEPSDFTRVSLSDAPQKSEKRSSIASGLKKIGNMGSGKRKKDSVSSVKEVV